MGSDNPTYGGHYSPRILYNGFSLSPIRSAGESWLRSSLGKTNKKLLRVAIQGQYGNYVSERGFTVTDNPIALVTRQGYLFY